jgi:hypothetical protein
MEVVCDLPSYHSAQIKNIWAEAKTELIYPKNVRAKVAMDFT